MAESDYRILYHERACPRPASPFRALSPELSGWGFFLCTQKDVRQGRGGDLFISLSLQDKTGVVRARIFNEAARLREEFDSGDFVKVQGRTDLFNGRMQLRRRAYPPRQPRSGQGAGIPRGGLRALRAAPGRRDVERAAGADPARPRSARARAAAADHRRSMPRSCASGRRRRPSTMRTAAGFSSTFCRSRARR